MANSYTNQLNLNQWAATDSFLRTEFNRDNQILEDAFAGLNTRAALLERQLEPMSYNLYRLLLQNYYDGKPRHQKSVLLDGFQDAAMLASVTPGAYHDLSAKHVRVLTAGAASFDTGFCLAENVTGDVEHNTNFEWIGWTTPAEDTTHSVSFTPSGYGVLNSVRLRLAQGYAANTHTVMTEILDGTTVLGTSNTVIVNAGIGVVKEFTFTFPGGVPVKGLHTYQLRITNASKNYYLAIVRNSEKAQIGAAYTFTPTSFTTGAITTPACDIGRNYDRAMCWVCHTGTVGVALRGNSGTFLPMTWVSSGQTQTLQGEACTESFYRLDAAPPFPNNQVTVQVALNTGNATCTVYDYGIVLL